ncbi:ATP-NAD kinase [Cadophora sp. DSE1049]|nr:ATP-NAD kinase [Cadophora sp. DSE1049]
MRIASGVREVSKELQRIPIKVAVRKVMIVTQGHDDHLVDLIRELAEWLMITPRYGNDLGVHVYVDAQLRESERFNASALLERDSRLQHMLKYWTPEFCRTSPAELDLVISLGGDETVLFTSWLFQTVVPPIMSLALSSLGFLTYFGFEFYKQHLDGIMGEQGMRVYLRMRYTCTISRGQRREEAGLRTPRKEEQFEVLNELMVMSYCGPAPYVSNLALYADDELLTDIQAEGCVFSTETGSIAHALSSGVSLIHPSIPAILLTPICPHTLAFRPMIFSDTLLLRVAVLHDSTSTAHCSFDGRGRIELYQGDSITINASQYPFPTVMRSTTEDWFQNVTKALKWNTRSVMQKRWSEVEERRDVTAIEDIEEAEDKKIDLTPDCLVHSRSSSPLQDSRLMMAPMNLQDRSEGFA